MSEPKIEESTATSGCHVGVYAGEVLTPRVEAYTIFAKVFLAAAMCVLLLAVIFGVVGSAAAAVFFILAVASGAASIVFFLRAHVFIPVAVPTNTIVYYGGKWHTQGPVWVHAADRDTSFWPKMVYTNPRRATWCTQPLRTADGRKITYHVDVTVQLNVQKADTFLLSCSYSIEEYLFHNRIEQAIKQEVAKTGFAYQRDSDVPEAKTTPYMERLQKLAMTAGEPYATEKGLILKDIYVYNPQTEQIREPSAALVPAEIVPLGEMHMSDSELLATLKNDYNIVIPELFDPVAVKRDLEILRNRQKPGLVRRFINLLARRVPQTEIGLLQAWEEYYTQVGATLGANHAARKKLERAEVNHRLFLEESMAKVHGHRADVADAEARIAEAGARKVKAIKETVDTVQVMFKAPAKPQRALPKKTTGQRIRQLEAKMKTELAEIDGIKDSDLRERAEEDCRKRYAQMINQLNNE